MAAAALLFMAVAAAYQPAWHGEPLWDDEGHLTRVELRTASGLAQIWTHIGATQQYYPVTHSAFWIQQALWGDAPLGYHLVNISLHASSAFVLGLILLRLGVPGAWLAAAIFALHPVHVESVAWISELKNVLSGVLYLSAALVYLEFDRTRRPRWYMLAALLFGLAILAKSVTVTLPAALLVAFWWRRGHLDWRSDVRPLLPFFAFGLAAGLVTVWFERNLIGAQGEEFGLTALERLLLAGRAAWFYAASLFWPVNLSFIYPRWHIDQSAPWQYVFPLAAAAALALAWRLRHTTRAPLAALLFFGGTLFPALGFFNVYPFRFSYVADHFQYLASIGLIVLVSASLAVAFRRYPPRTPVLAAAPLLLVLALLTWRHAHNYRDAETLYRATIAANPQAWLAHNNLAVVLLEGNPPEAEVREAATLAERALALKPDYLEARYNLGTALERLGHVEDAAAHYRAVLDADPGAERARHRLGIALRGLGRDEEALEALAGGTGDAPMSADRHIELGRALAEAGRTGEAITHFTEALRMQPASIEARHNLRTGLLQEGMTKESSGALDEAARVYRSAIDVDPAAAGPRIALGRVLHRLNRIDAAAAEYAQALVLTPGDADLHNSMGAALGQLGRIADAERHFAEAVRLDPSHADARQNLAHARKILAPRQPRP